MPHFFYLFDYFCSKNNNAINFYLPLPRLMNSGKNDAICLISPNMLSKFLYKSFLEHQISRVLHSYKRTILGTDPVLYEIGSSVLCLPLVLAPELVRNYMLK